MPMKFVDLVNRAVEQHVVIGHVEMAVVVDPLRLDPHQGRDEGRKENRFEIGAIEHGFISPTGMNRHPEVRAKRASKDDGPTHPSRSASAEHLRVT